MANDFELETLPTENAEELYRELTTGRSASHHFQVKAALSQLFKLLNRANPFVDCRAPKFSIQAVQIRYLTASPLFNDAWRHRGHTHAHLFALGARPLLALCDFDENQEEFTTKNTGGTEKGSV